MTFAKRIAHPFKCSTCQIETFLAWAVGWERGKPAATLGGYNGPGLCKPCATDRAAAEDVNLLPALDTDRRRLGPRPLYTTELRAEAEQQREEAAERSKLRAEASITRTGESTTPSPADW